MAQSAAAKIDTVEISEDRPGAPAIAFLLYGGSDTVIATTLLHALNAAADDLGETFAFSDLAGNDRHFVLQGQRHHIVVEDVEDRLPAADFETALTYPFLDTIFPAAKAIVDGHSAHVRIAVLGGEAKDTGGNPDLDTLEMDDFGPEAMLPRLRVLRTVANAYARQRFPLAVHWCQCDSLMGGPDFVQLAERDSETELFVKAVPYSSDGEAGRAYGAITCGAINVIGREVELCEAPMPPAWAADRLLQFVEKARSGVPRAGEAFRFPSDEILLVHDAEESPAFPNGHLRLTVEKLPGHPNIAVTPVSEASMGFLPETDPAKLEQNRAARAFGRR